MHQATVFEALEARTLLSGDVTAALVRGNLVLTGDVEDNSIVVNQVAGTASYTITSGDGTTTVNGGLDIVTIDDVTRGVRMKMLAGNDQVLFDTAVVTGAVNIDMGVGDDTLTLDAITATSLAVTMGAGNDTFTGLALTVTGATKVNLGSGDDTATLGGVFVKTSVTGGAGLDTVTFNQADITGNASVSNSSGGSVVTFADSSITGKASVTSGSGVDTATFTNTTVLRTVTVSSASGGSTFTATGSSLGLGDQALGLPAATVKISSATGVDVVTFDNTALGAKVTTSLGTGDNTVEFINNSTIVGNLAITTGSGVDAVNLSGLAVVGNTTIKTGAGTDLVMVDNSSLNGRTTMNTGAGADTLQMAQLGQADGVANTFGGAVSINMSSQDDTVLAGIAGNVGNSNVFDGTVLLRGGSGVNTLTFADSANTFAIEPIVVNFV